MFERPLRQLAAARLILGFTLALLTVGCGPTLAKMNTAAPIEKHSVFLGTQYHQDGKPIDGGDMLTKLEREPEASEHLGGVDALATGSTLLSAAGGALIGWPVGQAIAGAEDPMWLLAGIGAGCVAIAIPLAIVASNKVESAVDAHNRRFAELERQHGFAQRRPTILLLSEGSGTGLARLPPSELCRDLEDKYGAALSPCQTLAQ